MVTLGEHRGVVVVHRDPLPIRLDVRSIDVQMDEEWIPYVQSRVVCPLGDGSITAIDPQASDVWVSVTATRLFGRTDRLSDVGRRYRDRTLGDITAQFRGKTLAALTRSMYHDFSGDGSARRADTRTFKLMLREVEVNRKAATVTLTLASGEARLNDWQHMSSQTDRAPGANMVAKLNWVLNLAGFPEGITYASGKNPTDAQIGDEALRAPGSSALEFVTGLTRQHGLMLWCDEDGKWHLAEDRSRNDTRTLQSAGADRSVTEETTLRSRDEGWVTAVMVVYTWQNVDHYDIYSPLAPNPERALILRYNRPYPGPGLAAQVFRQVRSRGRAMDLVAVSEYSGVNPGQTVKYISPRESVSGRLAAIRWQFPDDEMSIRLREVGAA